MDTIIYRKSDKVLAAVVHPRRTPEATQNAVNVELQNVLMSDLGGIENNYSMIEVAEIPGGTVPVIAIDGTVSFVKPVTSVISYVDFDARFTEAEQLAVTKYIFGVSPSTGQALYPDLIQALNRAVASNSVDLLSAATDALLNVFVTAAVITPTRKIAILTP
mgnify:CR=1 FL=1|jgi:hypothetical protein|tara:strand:+ start:558 stop:1043 length:486 start_codon:yes stop_codon:yes gene_type:complete